MLGDIELAETAYRSELAMDEQMERRLNWQCPSCTANPPRKGTRLYTHFHNNRKSRGDRNLRLHLLLHKLEILRHEVVLRGLQMEEACLRKRLLEVCEADSLLLEHREYCEHLLVRDFETADERYQAMRSVRVAQAKVQEAAFSEEMLDIMAVNHRHQELFRFAIEEARSREIIMMDFYMRASFSLVFAHSPNEHVPFEVVLRPPSSLRSYELLSFSIKYFDFFPSSDHDFQHSATLHLLLLRRFNALQQIVCEDERLLSRPDLPEQELFLPRGVNRFNIEQLLADEQLDDEKSFLPVERTSADAYVANLSFVGSMSLFESAASSDLQFDAAELAMARRHLRRIIWQFNAAELDHRRRIENVERERRARLQVSSHNLFGLDARPTVSRRNPRFDIQLSLLVDAEKTQRGNLCEIEVLSFQRIERLWSEQHQRYGEQHIISISDQSNNNDDAVSSSGRGRRLSLYENAQRQQQQQQQAAAAARPPVPTSLRRPVSPPPTQQQQRRRTLFGGTVDTIEQDPSQRVRHSSEIKAEQAAKLKQEEKKASKASELLREEIFAAYGDPFLPLEEQVDEMKKLVEERRAMLVEKLHSARYASLPTTHSIVAVAADGGAQGKPRVATPPPPPPAEQVVPAQRQRASTVAFMIPSPPPVAAVAGATVQRPTATRR